MVGQMDALSYIRAVKDALNNEEPGKYDQFTKLLFDFKAQRIDTATVTAKMTELLKHHFHLLLGFTAFLPPGTLQITIPPGVPQPEPTTDDATSYLIAVKEAFHDEPAKYVQLIKLLKDFRDRSVDAASVIASVEELLKDHKKLLSGFNVFLSAKMKFVRKLKARFQEDDHHVYESVLEIMKMYREGNKSKDEAYKEVVALLAGHKDLVMELSNIFR